MQQGHESHKPQRTEKNLKINAAMCPAIRKIRFPKKEDDGSGQLTGGRIRQRIQTARQSVLAARSDRFEPPATVY